jgi:hypothetical protein
MIGRFRIVCLVLLSLITLTTQARDRLTEEQAKDWQDHRPWIVGSNFSPSTAINQLEMWQADTFDPTTIDRELGWAQSLGFTTMRVFLHDLLWKQDSAGLLSRMDQFLAIADKHHITIDFVLFDSVWDPNPKLGKQHDPVPGLHNSGWVQSPGAEMLKHPEKWDAELKPYVVGVVSHFKDDKRIAFWETINEPDNTNGSSYGKQEPPHKIERATELLKQSFDWARSADPSQPITSGVWRGNWPDDEKLTPTEKVQLHESDIISFHSYDPIDRLKLCIEHLRRYHRPIVCTEYMARPQKSTFDPILGYLKEENVGAINWGFVAGKTNTIYPWDSWQHHYPAEPKVWFHDIFRGDGTPYNPGEVDYIRRITGAPQP